MMKKTIGFLAGWLLLGAWGFSQQTLTMQPDALERHVAFLASDSLKGRKPGTPETALAARYILREMTMGGAQPIADQGFQYFDVVTGVALGEDNVLAMDDSSYRVESDYIPLAYSAAGGFDGGIVFAGFGFDLDQEEITWNDYENLDVSGKWVIILRGDPEPDDANSHFIPFSGIRSKLLTAKDKGALGVLLVSPASVDKMDGLMPLVAEGNDVTAGIPVLNIKRTLADQWLVPFGYTIDSLEQLIIQQHHPVSFMLPGKLSANVAVDLQREQAVNVITMVEGSDPEWKNEYLVVGAHYDHLGMGGPGSGSRMPDTSAVHNGADDNASGTAMVLELAKLLAAQQPDLKRSLIFVAFSAEEMGLLGSRYFIDHPPVPIGQIKGMFNFDMVGRFDKEKNSISVSGTGTSAEADSLLRLFETGLPFRVVHAPDGYGPSDHAVFYAENIPVFYFNTGVHTDYHTPFDDVEKLDFPTAAQVGDFAARVIIAVDQLPQSLTFTESGSKAQSGRMGRSLKVTLGIMPDFAGTEKRGLRVDGVTKGKPADMGGMLKGDIIVSVNGDKVGNIYEYMSRIGKLKAGQTCIVEVIRGESTVVLLIQL